MQMTAIFFLFILITRINKHIVSKLQVLFQSSAVCCAPVRLLCLHYNTYTSVLLCSSRNHSRMASPMVRSSPQPRRALPKRRPNPRAWSSSAGSRACWWVCLYSSLPVVMQAGCIGASVVIVLRVVHCSRVGALTVCGDPPGASLRHILSQSPLPHYWERWNVGY